MSPEGWIFVFGFRLLDVGLLVVWLIWFFRLRDDGEEPPDEGGGGGEGGPEPKPPAGPGGGDLPLPVGRVSPGDRRTRDGHRPSRTPRHRRHAPPLPTPLPARVRSPSKAPSRIRRGSVSPQPQASGLASHSLSNRSAGEPGGGGRSF